MRLRFDRDLKQFQNDLLCHVVCGATRALAWNNLANIFSNHCVLFAAEGSAPPHAEDKQTFGNALRAIAVKI